MANRDNKNSTKKLTVCAMLAALGVILLYVGSLIEVVDISMAVIASLLTVVAVIEYGGSAPWLIYGVTSILALVLLPNKTPAALYALFFGFYPILKEKFEKLPRTVSWVLKELTFNIALVLMASTFAVLLPQVISLHRMLIAKSPCSSVRRKPCMARICAWNPRRD